MALKILFPLKSVELFDPGYSRIVYIAEVLIALCIATAPSIVNVGFSSYGIITYPPIATMWKLHRVYYFYTSVIPIMTVICICGILMLLTLYKIHMVSHYAFKVNTIVKLIIDCQGYYIYVYYIAITF